MKKKKNINAPIAKYVAYFLNQNAHFNLCASFLNYIRHEKNVSTFAESSFNEEDS